jgi:hypothetical protein
VTIIAYADGHFFQVSREDMADDIKDWLANRFPR